MILFPAIDLYGGKVVRLFKGDFAQKTDYGVSPLETAQKYADAGCTHIHIVDLEGAKTGFPCHLEKLRGIAKCDLFVQYGGGLRSPESVRAALDAGADRVMVGSLLFQNPQMPEKLFRAFGAAVMPAVDVKGGQVVYSGWLEGTGSTAAEILKKLRSCGFTSFLITDTERDGLLEGYRRGFYAPLCGAGYEVVAAGGITTADDIAALAREGVAGAVVGKSLYEGRVTLEEALAAAKGAIK